MKKMWALYAVAAAVLYLVIHTLNVAGSFKSIEPHLEGTITATYSDIPGPEDMDLDEATGTVFISSTDRWKVVKGMPTDDGIFAFRADSANAPKKLATTYRGEFHPHGISFLRTTPSPLLFVVNHNKAGNFIEIFEFRNDTLFHQRSLSGPSMCCPNDVVAVAPDKFYVTNDHGNAKGFGRTLEEYLQLPFSSLLYYDGAFTEAYGGLKYGNGVNISNDGSRLYVATTIGRNLLTFDRDKATGQLTLVDKLKLKTGVDNIDVDAEGTIWIAAHPKLFAFVAHAKDSAKKSPSQILRITPQGGFPYKVEEVFMDDGEQISGSSIALRYKNSVYVGGVFQARVLNIEIKSPTPK